MKPEKLFRRFQLLAVAALVGAGLLALVFVMTSMAAGVERVALQPVAAPASAQKIGDYVWYDANANGTFDGGTDVDEYEFVGGIDGVRINLYKDANLNNQIDPGEFVASTVTGENPNDPGSTGWYEFDVVSGATYLVQVDASNFAPGGALAGMALTSASTIGPDPRKVVMPVSGATNSFDVDFGYVESGVVVDKTLLTPNTNPIYVGDGASFQIVITNTGHLTVTTLPLWDYYGPACLTFVTATITPDTVDPALGILHWNNLGQLDPGKSVTVTVNFTANMGTEMYWKEGGWPDYAPKGLPDFGQQQDGWGQAVGTPPIWHWSYCGPTAAADSLWWFDSKFETGTTPPPTVSDSYPLVTAYGAWDDHDPRNVEPLVNALATQMGTNATTGTTVAGLAAGISQYITNSVGAGQYTVTKMKAPTFPWVADEVRRSEDVILLLGFWQQLPSGGFVRLGGHYVAVAGVNAMTPTIAFSDPYTDRAEIGWSGRVIPDPHLSLHPAPVWITDTVHNDAKYVSHDAYVADLNPVPVTPGGIWHVDYAQSCDDISNFMGQNVGDLPNDPVSCLVSPIFTEVEYAVAVSPITPTIRCDPTVNIAVASGVVDELQNELPAAQDETPVRVEEKPTAVGLRSLQGTGQNAVGVLAAALVGTAVVGWGLWSVRRRRAER